MNAAFGMTSLNIILASRERFLIPLFGTFLKFMHKRKLRIPTPEFVSRHLISFLILYYLKMDFLYVIKW